MKIVVNANAVLVPVVVRDSQGRAVDMWEAKRSMSASRSRMWGLKIESDLPDEKVLFLSDVVPTGYMAAANAQIQENDIVALWGCGPVGQFAIASAFLLGAARVIAINRFPERLALARSIGATTVDYPEDDLGVLVVLKDLTGGISPDSCIDVVGLETPGAHLRWSCIRDRACSEKTRRHDQLQPRCGLHHARSWTRRK